MRFKDTIGISHLITGVENRMRTALDAALSRLQMSLAQYSALSALEMQTQPLTNADLARACGVTPQTMNRIVSALLRSRMLSKVEAEHGLKVFYQLTPLALKRLCSAHEAVDAIERESLRGLKPVEYKALQQSLRAMQQNLE